MLILCRYPLVIGGTLGAILGIVAGAATGIITAAITMVAFFPLTSDRARLYRTIITIVGIVINFATVYLLGLPLASGVLPNFNRSESQSLMIWSVYTFLPALVAGLGAWWVGGRMAKWYESYTHEPSQYSQLSAEASPESPGPAHTGIDLD